jgi:hypothetical protein
LGLMVSELPVKKARSMMVPFLVQIFNIPGIITLFFTQW